MKRLLNVSLTLFLLFGGAVTGLMAASNVGAAGVTYNDYNAKEYWTEDMLWAVDIMTICEKGKQLKVWSEQGSSLLAVDRKGNEQVLSMIKQRVC